MPLSNPVIVLPGITATYLSDQYPIPPETVWAVLEGSKSYERAALHPDDLAAKLPDRAKVLEAAQPTNIVAGQLYEIAYQELVEELRYNLRDREDIVVPVYPFGYDWRQPLELVEDRLADFVEEVIERTRLLRHYHRAGYGDDPKVNLVGHSMGGLVIAGYLARFGGRKRVAKVASLASPFRGSFEVVVKVATGTANLGTSPPSSREREAARVTPALYYLVPSFADGLDVDRGLPKSLFDAGAWQTSIIDTIAEYARLRGLEPAGSRKDRTERARNILAAMLKAAKEHRGRIGGLDLEKAGLAASDWLCVVGVDAETRVNLRIESRNARPRFVFELKDRVNQWKGGASPEARRRTGDGTVPFAGAVPGFLAYENLVCVTPDDFGFWEFADKLALRVGGFHGILPNMNLVQRLVVRHFTGRPDRHGNTWGRPPPGVEVKDWATPFPLEPK